MSHKIVSPSKSYAKGPGKSKRGLTKSERKARNKKNKIDFKKLSEVTLSKLVSECCNEYVTSPRMLTQRFLHVVLKEMNSLANREKSQSKVGVINQISFDLTDFASALDVSYRPDNNQLSHDMCVDLKVNLMKLRDIDESINTLMAKRKRIYERLESSYCLDINLGEDDRLQNNDPLNVTYSETSNGVESINIDDNSNEPSQLETHPSPQYFDESVLSVAAISAHLVPPVKQEICVDIENSTDLSVNKFSDYSPSHLLMTDSSLICACKNGTIARFCFKGSVLPHLPHRTNTYNLCSGPVAGMLLWNSSLIIATVGGSVMKCTLRCKIVKKFLLNEEICGITETRGLLYVATQSGKLNIINSRSLTLFKQPVELGYSFKSIKSTVYNTSPVIVSLTDKGEIIGTPVNDGCIGTPAFKFTLPGVQLFDIGLDKDVTFFCGSPQNTTCLHLMNGIFSHGKVIQMNTSSILAHEHLLFLGSTTGDVMIVNIKSMNTYFYQGIVEEKIISLVYFSSILYLGTVEGIYCLCIKNNKDIQL